MIVNNSLRKRLLKKIHWSIIHGFSIHESIILTNVFLILSLIFRNLNHWRSIKLQLNGLLILNLSIFLFFLIIWVWTWHITIVFIININDIIFRILYQALLFIAHQFFFYKNLHILTVRISLTKLNSWSILS